MEIEKVREKHKCHVLETDGVGVGDGQIKTVAEEGALVKDGVHSMNEIQQRIIL